MAGTSSQKFDRRSTHYDYDYDDDDLDFEESTVVPVKLEFPPTNDAHLVDDSIKIVGDLIKEESPKLSNQLQGNESEEQKTPSNNDEEMQIEEIILDDSSSSDLFEEKRRSKPEMSKSANDTVLSPLDDHGISDSPMPSPVSSQKIVSSPDTAPLSDLTTVVSDKERNDEEEVEQAGFSDPSKIVVFKMIDFSLFDKAAEQSTCPASSTDVDMELPPRPRSEDGNFKRMQSTIQHNDLMTLDGELLTFPSQAFLLSGGMGFICRSSEMQREAALLSFRLAGTLQAIARAVRRLASQPSGQLHATLRRLATGEKVSNLLADNKGYSPSQLELLSTLAEEPHLLRRTEGGALYHGNKLLLLGDSLCPVFQCFTSQFVLRSIKPVLQMLCDEYVLTSKTGRHTNCGCLSNPILKLSQVERNIPISMLTTWFRERAALSSAHGRLTEQLALLGRGRRPTKVVLLVDGSLYNNTFLQNLVPFPCETLYCNNFDFLTQAQTLLECSSFKEDSTLYVILASAGAMLDALPHLRFAAAESSSGAKTKVEGDDTATAPMKAPRPSVLADQLIDGALLLWRTVLCSTNNADVLFAPLPLIADPTPWATQQPVPNTALQQLACRYNAWVRLQHRATGRQAAPSPPAHFSQGEEEEEEDGGGASGPDNLLPMAANLKEELQTVLAQVLVDFNSSKSLLPIGRLRPPSARKFKSVLLVLEESFVGCVSSYLRHLPRLEVCLVPRLTAASSKDIVATALAAGDRRLVLLLPSWLRADAVAPLVANTGPNSCSVFRCLDKNVDLLGHSGEQMAEDLRDLMSSLKDSCPQWSVAVLPCLPLHLLRMTEQHQQGMEMFSKLKGNASLQVVLMEDKPCAKVPLAYSTCNKQVYELAVRSLAAEDLHSEALEKMGMELEAVGSSLVTESNCCPEPASQLFGPFGSLLSSVVFSCKYGFPDDRLPALATIPFNATYPELKHLAQLDAKALRYDKLVLVGNTAINEKLQSRFKLTDNVACFPSVSFASEAWNKFLVDVSAFPPNTLFIFLFDAMMLCTSEVYPECIKKFCSDSIIRYTLPPLNFHSENSVQEYVSRRFKMIYHKLKKFKKSLPNQSSVLVAPMAPQCVLRQEEDVSYFNHNLLHATFYTSTNRHPIIFKGQESSWQKLYECAVAELKQPCYVLDVGLENMVKSMTSKLEQKLTIVDNPRLCDDQEFPERDTWGGIMAELASRVRKLVFPITGISTEDKALIPIIVRCIIPTKPPTPLPALLPPPKPQTCCMLSTPPEGWLSEPCTLRLDAERVDLPMSFVQGVCSYFNPDEGSVKKATPSGWLVTVPDMVRAALLRTLLDGFRCTFVTLRVTPLDIDKPLPSCPSDELKRLRVAMATLLKSFALSCNRLFYHSFHIDAAFGLARKAECDFVEGLDATLCYLHRELRYLHVHHQQDIQQNLVLAVVVTESAEVAGALATELQQVLQDPTLYPPTVGGRRTPSLVTKDSSNSTGNVLLGTPRFVLALLRALSPPHSLRSLQLLLIEQIKSLMNTEQKMSLLHVIQQARAAHAVSGQVRPVVVCKEFVREELSGAHTVLGRTLRLVRRDTKGNGCTEDYDQSSLPSVTIKMPGDVSTSNIKKAAPSIMRPAVPPNIRPAGPSNISPRLPFGSGARFINPNGQVMPPHVRGMRPNTPMTGFYGRLARPGMQSVGPYSRPAAPNVGVLRPFMSSLSSTGTPASKNVKVVKALMPAVSSSTGENVAPAKAQTFLASASARQNVVNRIMTSGTTIQKACNVNSKYAPASQPVPGFSAPSGVYPQPGRWIPPANAPPQYAQPAKSFTGLYSVPPPNFPGAATSGQQSPWQGGSKGNVPSFPPFMSSAFGVRPPPALGYNHGQYSQTSQPPPGYPSYSQTPKPGYGYSPNPTSVPLSANLLSTEPALSQATGNAASDPASTSAQGEITAFREDVYTSSTSRKRQRSRSRSKSRSRSRSRGRHSRKESRYRSRSRSRSSSHERQNRSRSHSRSPSRSRYRSRSPIQYSRHEVKTSVVGEAGTSSVRRDVAITIKSNSRTGDGKMYERYERIRHKVDDASLTAPYTSRGHKSVDWPHSAGNRAGTSSVASAFGEPVTVADSSDDDGTLQEYGEDVDTPSYPHRDAPPPPPFRSAREAIIRSELEDRYKQYADAPEQHPQYEEHRDRFFDLYEEQSRSGRGQASDSSRHKEGEWRKAWKGLLSDMLEKEVVKRMNEPRESLHSGNGMKESGSKRGGYESRHEYKDERSWQQTRTQSTARECVNEESGTAALGKDDGTCDRNNVAGIDLDPNALAKRTRGLNTVELALLLKQLVCAAKLPHPEIGFKLLLKQVSTLHMEYAQKELGFD